MQLKKYEKVGLQVKRYQDIDEFVGQSFTDFCDFFICWDLGGKVALVKLVKLTEVSDDEELELVYGLQSENRIVSMD